MADSGELCSAINARLVDVGANRTVATNFETKFEDFFLHGLASRDYSADGTKIGSSLDISISGDGEDDLIMITAPHRDRETGDSTQWSVMTRENYAHGDIAARLGIIAVEFVSDLLDATHSTKRNKPGLRDKLQFGYDILANLLDEDFDAIERESRFKLAEVNGVLIATDRYVDAITRSIESTSPDHHINEVITNAVPLAYEGQEVELNVVFKRALPDEDPIGTHRYEVDMDVESEDEPLNVDGGKLVKQGIHFAIGKDGYLPRAVEWKRYPERFMPLPASTIAGQDDIERFIEIVKSTELTV